VFHFIVSWFNIIGNQQRGAVYFFGKPLYNVGRGIHFVPWLVCKLDKESRIFFEDEIPTTQDKIYRSSRDESDFIPIELQKDGYRHPIRATFNYSKSKETNDPFDERVVLEIPGVIFWSIRNLIRFRGTIGDITKARKQMADIYTSIITTDLPKMTASEFFENRKNVDKKIFKELDKLTDEWGVDIQVARIKEPKQSHNLNAKIQEIPEAKAKRRANELEGIGEGAREKGILEGRTDGLLYMAEKLGVSSESILSAESAREIAKDVDNLVSVGSSGYTDILGIVAAGTKMFKQQSTEKRKEIDK